MLTRYDWSPYWWHGVYIGGVGMYCAQYLNDVRGQGWNFEPIWVGPQAPCTGGEFAYTFNYDPGTAFSQGQSEAVNAYDQLLNLGFAIGAAGTPAMYDLEAFNTSDSACVSAVAAFIEGWMNQLHVTPAQLAGVYGSTCGSSLPSSWGSGARRRTSCSPSS